MKCHVCGEDLVCDNVQLWNVTPRYCVAYACRNRQCRPPPNVSTDSSVNVHLVLPDQEINYYLLRFTIREKWYQVASIQVQCHPGETVFSVAPDIAQAVYAPLIVLPRFIPMDWNKPLTEQSDILREKLKTLICFL